MMTSYITTLWINVDAMTILKELKVNFLNKGQKEIEISNWLGIVDIDLYAFLKQNEDDQLNILTHGFLHHLSVVLNKYTYDINFWKPEKINVSFVPQIEVHNIRYARQSWYHTNLIGKHKNCHSYWSFFNEWMTDIITNKIVSENWLESRLFYRYNVLLIDRMILHAANITNIPYETLLDLLIKWYFHWDYKTLQLFEKVLWKDFWEIFMSESSKNDTLESIRSLESKWFFKNYPFMKFTDSAKISDNLNSFFNYKKQKN
jgi:hypothetical protein